jgi:hypothetical protein
MFQAHTCLILTESLKAVKRLLEVILSCVLYVCVHGTDFMVQETTVIFYNLNKLVRSGQEGSSRRFTDVTRVALSTRPTLLHAKTRRSVCISRNTTLVLPDRMCWIYTYVSRDNLSGPLDELCSKRTISCVRFVYTDSNTGRL